MIDIPVIVEKEQFDNVPILFVISEFLQFMFVLFLGLKEDAVSVRLYSGLRG